MSQTLSSAAQRVQDVLSELGCSSLVFELPASTRTAADAAQANGCTVGQIAKSLIFVTKQSRRPVLVITSGSNRVNEKKIGELMAEEIEKADANLVREATGFAIGGVAPVGLKQQVTTFIDSDLLQYSEIWAAAGTPNSQFKITPQELVRITEAPVVSVT